MRKLTKFNVIDLIYDVNTEFTNELDYDYESDYKKDLTEQDLNMIEEAINRFCSKLENTIEEELFTELKFNFKESEENEKYKSSNITLEDVYNNLNTLILTMSDVPKELLELQKDIEEELTVLDENYFECNKLIERAYILFDKYIV